MQSTVSEQVCILCCHPGRGEVFPRGLCRWCHKRQGRLGRLRNYPKVAAVSAPSTKVCVDCKAEKTGLFVRGLCKVCWARHKRHGDLVKFAVSERNRLASAIGHTRVVRDGYVDIKTVDGFRRQHRVVMEEHLGRRLVPGENVHHINGIRSDNRLLNLELWYVGQPAGQRVDDLLEYAVREHRARLMDMLT